MIEFDDKHGHIIIMGIEENSSNEKGIIFEPSDECSFFLRLQELDEFIEILIQWRKELI